MAWKMAASANNPLTVKSSLRNPKGFIQMIDKGKEEAAAIQAMRKWCALHKTDKHSNTDCRAQKESTTGVATTWKKRLKGAEKRKSARPRKLKFKSKDDKKKFLRSIEDAEGVSLESQSSDDEAVVEHSLLQMENDSSDTQEEDVEGDLHIMLMEPNALFDDPDVNMESVFLYTNQDGATAALDSSVSSICLGGEKAESPMSTKAEFDSTEISSQDTLFLETSMNTPIVPTFKEEENPFSPERYPTPDEEMFPSLTPQGVEGSSGTTSTSDFAAVMTTKKYFLMNGVYYQQVPPPHNVVAQSAIPTPELNPVAVVVPSTSTAPADIPLPVTDNEAEGSEIGSNQAANSSVEVKPDILQDAETSVALEAGTFQPSPAIVPAPTQAPTPAPTPAPAPSSGNLETKPPVTPSSRWSSPKPSKDRRREVEQSSRGVDPDSATSVKRIRGVGRGRTQNRSTTPLVAPATSLSGITVPRDNLRITIPSGNNGRIVEVIPHTPDSIAHLAKLDQNASSRWDLQLPTTTRPDFKVALSTADPQEDSDLDLRTGEIREPHPWTDPIQFTYNSHSVLEDHQRFAEEVLRHESDLWDRTRVDNNPSLFYHAYFLDQQKIHEVRTKGTMRIQQFNVNVTRQSPNKDVTNSSRANREMLESKFRIALTHIYRAFEVAFQFEHPEFISDLRNHLVKTAVTQISSLFASAHCRSCHRGRRMDAVWKLRRFKTLLPYLAEVPLESYRRAEDYQANVLLDKTALVADGPLADKYRLGLSSQDQRLYLTLGPAERQSFDDELAALANVNSLMMMSRRWENHKDSAPALEINLGHQAFQKICQLRRMNLLPLAQMLLHLHYDRHEQLIVCFGKSKNQN